MSLVVYDPPEVARARATSRLTSDAVSSLAGADRAALVLAVAKDDDLKSFERRERTATRASEAKNRDRTRYMGFQDASASCLVSAHDRIMGTHRGCVSPEPSGIPHPLGEVWLRYASVTIWRR